MFGHVWARAPAPHSIDLRGLSWRTRRGIIPSTCPILSEFVCETVQVKVAVHGAFMGRVRNIAEPPAAGVPQCGTRPMADDTGSILCACG